MNVLLSRLNEQQLRWYIALGSKKVGHGGDQRLSEIAGMDDETIQRGRRDLDEDLVSRPPERTRETDGGQPAAEKRPIDRGGISQIARD